MEGTERSGNHCFIEQQSGHRSRLALERDETGARFGTATAWARELGYAHPVSIYKYITHRSLTPYRYAQHLGKTLPLWHESDLIDLVKRREEGVRPVSIWDGMDSLVEEGELSLVQPASSMRIVRTPRSWEDMLRLPAHSLTKPLREIGAVPVFLQQSETCDLHTVLAATEHRRHRHEVGDTLMPDPVLGDVIGTIQAWADILGVSRSALHYPLTLYGVSPVLVLDQPKTRLYSQQQLRQTLPHVFSPPPLIARQSQSLIVPGELQRYVTASKTTAQTLLHKNVVAVEALNGASRKTSYFPEGAVRAVLGQSYPVPIQPEEYLRSVAKVHSVPYVLETLSHIEDQARLFHDQGVQQLSSEGMLRAPSGTLLAPRSVLLCMLLERQASEHSALSQRLATLRPAAIADVVWSDRWSNAARLWLYDVTAFLKGPDGPIDKLSLSGNVVATLEFDGTESQRVKSSTPNRDIKQRIGLNLSDESRRQQQADRRRLDRLRSELAHLDSERVARDERRAKQFQERLLQLNPRPEAPADLHVILIGDSFVNFKGERFGSASRWIQEYPALFPDAAHSWLLALTQRGDVAYHETPDGKQVYSERDILCQLLNRMDQDRSS